LTAGQLVNAKKERESQQQLQHRKSVSNSPFHKVEMLTDPSQVDSAIVVFKRVSHDVIMLKVVVELTHALSTIYETPVKCTLVEHCQSLFSTQPGGDWPREGDKRR
jgi:hypothetical protein